MISRPSKVESFMTPFVGTYLYFLFCFDYGMFSLTYMYIERILYTGFSIKSFYIFNIKNRLIPTLSS